jgi:large subunit ribosomal protein L33
MARKRQDRAPVKLVSTESGHVYWSEKNRKNDPSRLELKKYDPLVRRHVVYRESR